MYIIPKQIPDRNVAGARIIWGIAKTRDDNNIPSVTPHFAAHRFSRIPLHRISSVKGATRTIFRMPNNMPLTAAIDVSDGSNVRPEWNKKSKFGHKRNTA